MYAQKISPSSALAVVCTAYLTSPADKILTLSFEISFSPAILHTGEYLSNILQKAPTFQFNFKAALCFSKRWKLATETQEINESTDRASLELALGTESFLDTGVQLVP